MIRPINQQINFLAHKSRPATVNDQPILLDLRDTLVAHQADCLGMAANMIGENKQIIAFFVGPLPVLMVNPQIKQRKGLYQTVEGCLSLKGQRQTKRFQTITVSYLDQNFRLQQQTFSGLIAQTIQHEIDHCNGRLI
ncbi:peptide deformylase [Liquorilactobacillus sicerae]|uniref:peptide deformylase n=1 Tax=Liquorilactobacillus sicerae TaxID=1416943 RepID=UPI0024808EDE|nr:peptide deformylase [Liquorilactobacillus sicerae]